MTTTNPEPLLAYHNNPRIKKKYLARVRAHRLADEIVKGQYWEDGKGCAVGCTLHSSNHAAYETIPMILARLEDRIFEGLDLKLAKVWPERFLEAAQVGADLSMVWPQFAHWMLVDPADGVIKFAKTDRSRKAIQAVADLFARWIAGSKPPLEEWRLARSNAAAAYAAAAYAAAAYAAAAARKKFFALVSEKLLELMQKAPVLEMA